MEELRNYLLRHNLIDVYSDILDFLRNPGGLEVADILCKAPCEIRCEIERELLTATEVYRRDRAEYSSVYLLGQVVIWQEILLAFKELQKYSQRIKTINLNPDTRNYEESSNELLNILGNYAKMQGVMSTLEDTLGVDRFLDRVSEDVFSILQDILKETKSELEKKCLNHKRAFQEKWNTTHLFKLLGHKLVTPNLENQVCDLSTSNAEQVILFVVDGFGLCQYLWNKNIDAQKVHYTFRENIFHWLSSVSGIKEYMLGSAYVTDTAAGLSQIYQGQRSNKTGIIASKLRKKYSPLNFFSTKSIDPTEFDNTFTCRNSITDVASTYGVDSKVYYCSKYQTPVSGFSKSMFSSALVEQILPPERVFPALLDDVHNGLTQGLQVIYLTGIDNSGHTMGAYSAFEKYEHLKIGSLLKNFLIELAGDRPDLFDGKRSIMITADHGMYESSNVIVSRFDLSNALNDAGIRNVKLVENNRAMLLYNEGRSSLVEIKTVLQDYFRSIRVAVDIGGRDDHLFSECIVGDTDNEVKPDMIIRFVGEGLFYTSRIQNKHLLHYGGHGGFSVDEVFVPQLEIPLNSTLLENIQTRFLSKM